MSDKGYSVYADGKIEQWDTDVSNSNGIITVNLPIYYSNSNYNIMAVDVRNAVQSGTSTAIFVSSSGTTKSTSGFTLCQYQTSAFKANWRTVGY